MSKPTVVVADDDPLLRAIVEHKLRAAGFEVLLVDDGRAAIEEARRSKPDILVLDALMPILDGFEALRRIKADPDLGSIAVVMLTQLKRQEDVVTALQLGAADYLHKPFNPDELVARLQRLARVSVT